MLQLYTKLIFFILKKKNKTETKVRSNKIKERFYVWVIIPLNEFNLTVSTRLIGNLFALQPTKKHKSVTHDFSS